MHKYSLDTNIFIQVHRVNYPFDIFSSFWEKIIELAERGNIISIDKVKMEISISFTYYICIVLNNSFFFSKKYISVHILKTNLTGNSCNNLYKSLLICKDEKKLVLYP